MNSNSNVIDIKIGGIQRKRYRINGDDSKIIELNPSDFNITVRLNEAYPKLAKCESRIAELNVSENNEDNLESFAKTLSELDNEMRELIDYIFDSQVSDICCDGGSMYDLIDGYMRYEVIVDNLVKLYEDNISKESKKIQKRIKSHTSKYTS